MKSSASEGVEGGQDQQGIPWQEENVGQGSLDREQGGAGQEVNRRCKSMTISAKKTEDISNTADLFKPNPQIPSPDTRIGRRGTLKRRRKMNQLLEGSGQI
jgi:hypothetical protein